MDSFQISGKQSGDFSFQVTSHFDESCLSGDKVSLLSSLLYYLYCIKLQSLYYLYYLYCIKIQSIFTILNRTRQNKKQEEANLKI